jgi:hypothetical protein
MNEILLLLICLILLAGMVWRIAYVPRKRFKELEKDLIERYGAEQISGMNASQVLFAIRFGLITPKK